MKKLEDLTVRDYFSIVRRRIWYVIVVAVLAAAASVAIVMQIPPSFTSETTILVTGRVVAESYVDSIVRDSNADRVEFVRQQLQSRTFWERIVQEFQLANGGPSDMESVINAVKNRYVLTPLTASAFRLSFTASDRNLAQAVTRRLAERVMQLNDTFRKEKVYGTDQFLDEQLRLASDELSKVEQKISDFYAVHFPGIPRDGANLESVAAQQAEMTKADLTLQSLISQRDLLQRRIQDQKEMKVASKAAPVQTKSSPAPAVPEPPAPPTALESKLAARQADLNLLQARYSPTWPDVVQMAREVKELEAQVAQEKARAVKNLPARVTINETRAPVLAMPELDSSDFLIAELQLELQRVIKDIAAAEQTRKQVASKMALYQARINPPAALAQQLSALNREYDQARLQYTDMSGKKAKSGMAAEAENQVFRIVDEANLPQHATGQSRRTLASVGLLIGVLLGIGAAFGREMLDSTIQDEDQASSELKMPVLTSVPQLKTAPKAKNKNKKGELRILESAPAPASGSEFRLKDAAPHVREVVVDPTTMAGEQFRLLRAKLSVMQKTVGLKSVVITSAVPDEGKTFTASCIAAIIAQDSNKKVLLIDGDLRTASAGNIFGIGRGTIGLSGLMQDGIPGTPDLLMRSLVKCADSHLYLLPTGPLVKQPAELLSSTAFEALMRQAQEFFDWVIVDSPPVLAVSDTNLIAPACDATLLVMHAGKTPSGLAKDAIKRIGPERICGVVLNRVRNLKMNQYYYAYYQKQTTA